jgi:proteasome assembly chaperone (PAC2) family protein
MMPEELRIFERPELERPVLVAAFRGWNDGAQGASLAASYLAKLWSAEKFADVDPEGFFDFQATRPHVALEQGMTRRIDWPETAFYHCRPPDSDRDVVLLVGIEPNVRWRTFTELIGGFAKELGIELVITLGALLADVPHTRHAPVTGSASDPELVERLGLQASRYEGPTGIVGVLHDAARTLGVPTVSLWGAAPHYLPAGTNPKVALSLLDKLGELLGVPIDTDEMQTATAIWEKQVREAVAEDDNLATYVSTLEDAVPEESALGQIPSGEQLAQELERFLREHPPEGGSTV